ncbi:hypothetical protein D9619_008905 [Psilocybe cf. subviscida]|uniref:Uncharacterized protein n=1 Tax=Psilocybe cf. subviscida TaxID=2480587 RepID=A0A8H5B9Q3_9AGAR|nr:hypothetical protein D9619_008905 [Psilocybe cf. subviscida]
MAIQSLQVLSGNALVPNKSNSRGQTMHLNDPSSPFNDSSHILTNIQDHQDLQDRLTYDYPTQIQESVSEMSTSIGYNITSFAATNLKGTNLPVPAAQTFNYVGDSGNALQRKNLKKCDNGVST